MSEPTQDVPSAAATDAVADALDAELLAALADDFGARLRRREHPTVEEYVAKHPALADRIRNVLSAVALIEQGRNDSTLSAEGPGSTIGRYKLLERIGEGGFGVVYMAEQQHPVRRKVALKLIKPGMDSRQVLARFDAERQALAIMDHPNIARVFDGGVTDTGRPYFVMELVKGEPITAYCDHHQLPPSQRLELFVAVCQAVQHAHQKGIIHRDLKPTNVLVATHDTKPVVKVIDFGVAKALGQELTDNTLFTGFAQLLGTPLYMSPEQAGHSSLDVDTRSDIYSLGVLLYELLTGTTPFDRERFKKAAEDEIRRIIREEEPPRPSTRLSGSKDALPSISANRHTEPAKLTKLVRGELDWIVMKALEKDRNRRYETANGFAADVQRYLADEPVQACPPSTIYRLRKFVRRNRASVAIAALVLLFLVLTGSAIGWAVRDRAARHAKVGAQVEQILSEVQQLEREQKWLEALAATRRAEAVVAGGGADAATARRVGEQLKEVEFIDRLEQIRMQNAAIIDGKRDYAGKDREYARAFHDYGIDVDELPVDASIEHFKARTAFAVAVAIVLDDWMSSEYWHSKPNAPRRKWLVAVARGVDPEPLRGRLRATWLEPDSAILDELLQIANVIDIPAHHPVTFYTLAKRLKQAKQPDAALRLLQRARSVYPGDFWLNFGLAAALALQRDYDGAVRFYTAAIAIRPNAIWALSNLGNVLNDQKKPDEAVACFRRAIAIEQAGAIYSNLGVALYAQKKPDEAISCFRKAIELDPKDAMPYSNLGLILMRQKQLDEGVANFRKAIELEPDFAQAYSNLACALCNQKKFDEAMVSAQKAIELDPKNTDGYTNLAFTFRSQKKLDDAIATCHKAIEIEPTGDAYNELALALNSQGKLEESIAAYRKAIEVDPNHANAHVNLGWLLATTSNLKFRDPRLAAIYAKKGAELSVSDPEDIKILGVAHYRNGDFNAAIAAIERSMELRKGVGYTDGWLFLAMSHWQLGNRDDARRCYDQAVQMMAERKTPSENLNRFRGEAAELLGLDADTPRTAPTSPSTSQPGTN